MVSSRRTSSICTIISRAAEVRERDDCAPHTRREEDLGLFGVYRDVPPIGAPHRDVKQQSIPGAPVESLEAVVARGGDGRWNFPSEDVAIKGPAARWRWCAGNVLLMRGLG